MEYVSTLNPADVGAFILLLIGTLHGMHRGLSGEVGHVLGLAAGAVVAVLAFGPVTELVRLNTAFGDVATHVVAVVISAVLFLTALVLVRAALRSLIAMAVGPRVDRMGGGMAGAVRAAAIIVIVFTIMNLVPDRRLNAVFGENSLIGGLLIQLVPTFRAQPEDENPPNERNALP